MIFEVHHYKCRYATAAAQVELYEEKGRAAPERHCGKPVVFRQARNRPSNRRDRTLRWRKMPRNPGR